MIKNLFKLVILVLVAGMAFAIAACSAVPAPIQQALATATSAPTDTPSPAPTAVPTAAPAAKATSQPKPSQPAAANNPLAQLRRLGLEGGVVDGNNGSSISLRLGKTSEQLQIAPTTLVVVPGTANAQASDIQLGDRVVANVPNGDNQSPAALILDFPKGYTTSNVMLGLVQVNAKGTVTLKTRSGSQDITPTASTTIVNMQGAQPAMGTLKEVTRGDAAVVIGQKNGDQFSPQVIVLLDRASLQGGRQQNQPTATPTPQ